MEVGVPPALPFENKVSNLLHPLGSWANTCLLIADLQHKQSLIKGFVDSIFTANKFPKVPFKEIYVRAGEGGTPATSNPEYYDNVGHRDRYLDSLFRVDEPFPRDFYSIKTGRYVYLYQQESIPTHNRFGAKSATNLVQDDIPNSQNTFPTIYGLCILTANIPFLGVYPMRL